MGDKPKTPEEIYREAIRKKNLQTAEENIALNRALLRSRWDAFMRLMNTQVQPPMAPVSVPKYDPVAQLRARAIELYGYDPMTYYDDPYVAWKNPVLTQEPTPLLPEGYVNTSAGAVSIGGNPWSPTWTPNYGNYSTDNRYPLTATPNYGNSRAPRKISPPGAGAIGNYKNVILQQEMDYYDLQRKWYYNKFKQTPSAWPMKEYNENYSGVKLDSGDVVPYNIRDTWNSNKWYGYGNRQVSYNQAGGLGTVARYDRYGKLKSFVGGQNLNKTPGSPRSGNIPRSGVGWSGGGGGRGVFTSMPESLAQFLATHERIGRTKRITQMSPDEQLAWRAAVKANNGSVWVKKGEKPGDNVSDDALSAASSRWLHGAVVWR